LTLNLKALPVPLPVLLRQRSGCLRRKNGKRRAAMGARPNSAAAMGLRSAPKHPNDETEGSKVGKARYSYGTLVLWFRYTEGKHFSVLFFLSTSTSSYPHVQRSMHAWRALQPLSLIPHASKRQARGLPPYRTLTITTLVYLGNISTLEKEVQPCPSTCDHYTRSQARPGHR
jgi:hypothetical protein